MLCILLEIISYIVSKKCTELNFILTKDEVAEIFEIY